MALSSPLPTYSAMLIIDVTTARWNNATTSNFTNETFPGTRNVTIPERAAIYIYPGPVICMFGMVCNILNLCVLSQPELSDSPYTYLTAIAVADLGMLTISFSSLVSFDHTPSFAKAIYDLYIFFGVGNIFFNSSVWFIVLMTIERMLFVVRPLHTRSSVKRARIMIAIVVICCCLLNIPRFLCYEVRELKKTGIYYTYGTPFRETDTFLKTSWFHAIMINFIPLVILLVTNAILIVAVHRARKQREEYQMNSNQEQSWRKDEVRLTRTLISVVIVFIVCTLPSAFVEDPIAYAFFSGEKTWSDYLGSPGNQTLIYISNLLLFLNCSLNFILYCAFNNKFRRAMTHFFVKLRFNRKLVNMNSSSRSHSRSNDSTKSLRTKLTNV